ncbi:uncharacterized protein PGTG_20465 [Puccinia graminis f. sp. tritici CRL 75-36-700-3]|uniref:Uncharacterized protein n=1 Tax=Puccinia graminis f. sp. tritici (strain CRL 75-36-700-3 / race SCCL) TaxID=418459 RepID=E3NY60_PUCGT|nr:uncharacterized protein PGTG_20465 [Puccinia graminis f. sp. tritici CRL 75-36-700-3]EFP94509.1 hypothetical protein PGTG_20465 [Puccinia graminis f. sp. tritici CRL 75-36-700-3]
MVETNITRATSKKIKESTSGRDKLEEIAIKKALIPTGGIGQKEAGTTNEDTVPNTALTGNTETQASDGNVRAHSGSILEVPKDKPHGERINKTVYSHITDISDARRDRAPAAMNIPFSLDVDNSDVRKDQAFSAMNGPAVFRRTGQIHDLTVEDPEADRSPAVVSSSFMNERQEMWNRATEAQDAGDAALAEMLFRAIGSMTAQRNTANITPRAIPNETFAVPRFHGPAGVTYQAAQPQILLPSVAPETATGKKFFLTEGDLVYAIGSVTNHNSVGFAPFLDENIRKLRSPLPLTIFNRKWQQRAMAHHLDRRQRSDESSNDKDKSGGYKGFAFIQEWTQTYAQWTRNHRSFRKTLNDVYKIIEFSKLLGTHKNNGDDITEEFGFMVAFRYDMEVRNNTFSHRITDEDVKNAIPDISQRKESVVEQCYNQCRNFGELEWEENLYAPGHSHANHNPLTGCLRQQKSNHFPSNNQMIHNPYMQQQQQYGGNHFYGQPNTNNFNGYNNIQGRGYNGGPHYNQGGSAYNNNYNQGNFGNSDGKKRPRGGYRGSNYSDNPQGRAENSQGKKGGGNTK